MNLFAAPGAPTRAAHASSFLSIAPVRSLSLALTIGAASVGLLAAASHAAPGASKKRAAKTTAKSAPTRKLVGVAAGPQRAANPLPRYLPLRQIEMLRAAKANIDWGGITPYAGGQPLPSTLQTLPGASGFSALPPSVSVPALPKLKSRKPRVKGSAQAIPNPIPPATVRPARPAAPVVPRWVRYPLEFQLCGIGIGTRAVDKDRFNRIDRYGLFALHGNPTAVVVPGLISTANTGGPGDVAASGGAGGSGGGSSSGGPSTGASATTAPQIQNISINQRPPAIAALFPGPQNDEIPDWASAITVQLDNNHVQWLYNRDTYSMGFVVDRLGFCDAIVVAGTASPIARTQLEDPVHTIRLGDDLRKVLFRYGYPDTIESYTSVLAGVGFGGAGATGAPGGGAGGAPPTAPPPGAGAPGGEGGAGGAAGAAEVGNEAFRIFELRYEQSYNVVFTIRNNRVVRIYIFGDPDFFNDRRRRQIRTQY